MNKIKLQQKQQKELFLCLLDYFYFIKSEAAGMMGWTNTTENWWFLLKHIQLLKIYNMCLKI